MEALISEDEDLPAAGFNLAVESDNLHQILIPSLNDKILNNPLCSGHILDRLKRLITAIDEHGRKFMNDAKSVKRQEPVDKVSGFSGSNMSETEINAVRLRLWLMERYVRAIERTFETAKVPCTEFLVNDRTKVVEKIKGFIRAADAQIAGINASPYDFFGMFEFVKDEGSSLVNCGPPAKKPRCSPEFLFDLKSESSPVRENIQLNRLDVGSTLSGSSSVSPVASGSQSKPATSRKNTAIKRIVAISARGKGISRKQRSETPDEVVETLSRSSGDESVLSSQSRKRRITKSTQTKATVWKKADGKLVKKNTLQNPLRRSKRNPGRCKSGSPEIPISPAAKVTLKKR